MSTQSTEPAPPPTPAESQRHLAPARCLKCEYVIAGLPSPGVCPECSKPFDLSISSTFTRQRTFRGWNYWASGIGSAAGVGLVLMALDFYVLGGNGVSIWVGVPVLMGALSGYFLRAHIGLLVLSALLLGGVFIVGMVSMSIGGVFCALVLSAFLAVPIGLGWGLGIGVRAAIQAAGVTLRKPLILLIALAIGLGMAFAEKILIAPSPSESVQTSVVMDAPVDLAWASVMFYEEVKHPPPWILRIGLVRPIRTEGTITQPGDRKVCVYNKGRLVKQAVAVDAPHRLEFQVVEQHIGYERDVLLTGGWFVLDDLDGRRTRVTLVTEYKPLLGPRVLWRWGEEWAMHTLHRHVLMGMALKADELAGRGRADAGKVGEP